MELAEGEYPHLKGLWFSDVCMGTGELEIDILVGADYLWSFQKDCTIRGGALTNQSLWKRNISVTELDN